MCVSDLNNKSTKEKYTNPTPSTNKIIPTIGKKKNTVLKGKPTAKLKKFVPPIISTPHKKEQKKQERIDNIQAASNVNTLKENTSNTTTKDGTSKKTTSKEKPNSPIQPTKTMNNIHNELQCTQDRSLIQYSSCSSKFGEYPINFDYLSMNSEVGNTEDSIIQPGNTECTQKRTKKDSNIAGVILGSLNVLNDEEFLLSENLSQETQSDQSSVKNLSRIQSFCSVTSLNKIYKNLDVKSFESKDNQTPDSFSKDYKIPEGEEYLKLFKNKPKKKKSRKYPPMSIEFGDIGFNKKYSDYIKEIGFVPAQMQADENDTFMKILEMYPEENEIFIKMKFPK